MRGLNKGQPSEDDHPNSPLERSNLSIREPRAKMPDTQQTLCRLPIFPRRALPTQFLFSQAIPYVVAVATNAADWRNFGLATPQVTGCEWVCIGGK